MFERSEFVSLPVVAIPFVGTRRALCRVAFSLGTFFWRRKRKYLARRGETRHASTKEKPSRVFEGNTARGATLIHPYFFHLNADFIAK
ncbi:MAG: hypothetical protein A3I66_09545 [Burkholderiales bacterium RIFCSPLOWO2_02_FULL_57_36]|nr:MAG: hypothetical protein A3I66_09545 [Burkholderiales bacterium RIFCSPLOWO2_02_FULL_57_36]